VLENGLNRFIAHNLRFPEAKIGMRAGEFVALRDWHKDKELTSE